MLAIRTVWQFEHRANAGVMFGSNVRERERERERWGDLTAARPLTPSKATERSVAELSNWKRAS